MKRKIKLDIKGFLNKKENVAILAVAMIFCAGIAINNVKTGNIPLHDGDILVDSQNIKQEEQKTDESEEENGWISLEEQRAQLNLKRQDLLGGYEDTIKNSTNEAEQKNALKKKEQLTAFMEQETALEAMIQTKRLPESLVIITEQTVTVTVDEQELKQNLVAKICNLVMQETERSADKIIIQSAY